MPSVISQLRESSVIRNMYTPNLNVFWFRSFCFSHVIINSLCLVIIHFSYECLYIPNSFTWFLCFFMTEISLNQSFFPPPGLTWSGGVCCVAVAFVSLCQHQWYPSKFIIIEGKVFSDRESELLTALLTAVGPFGTLLEFVLVNYILDLV